MQSYSRPAIWLHWTVAALVVGNTALGLYAEAAPDDWVRPLIDAHKSLGITLLGLAVLRLSWRLSHAPPPLPVSYRLWERTAATLVHAALYALVFALPLTGWAHDSAWKGWEAHPMRLFWLVPWPRIGAIAALDPDLKQQWHDAIYFAHQAAAWAIYALLAVHILGALKHQWIDGHAELQRMGVGGSAGKTLGREAGEQ
jgi:cytochrome b561